MKREKKSITREDFARYLNDTQGFNMREARELVDTFFLAIQEGLTRPGQDVRLPGFGRFFGREKTERPGLNPKTGVRMKIKARRVAVFKPSQKLKDRIYMGLDHIE